MRALTNNEQHSIEQIFKMNQKTLLKVMNQYLTSKYKKVIRTNDYIIAVGDIPVAMTSHLDTVFAQPPAEIYYDKAKNVMWSPDGLGADDRAGVFSILQIIRNGFRPTVIFTTDEEIGSLGAAALVQKYPKAISDLKYIIEMDRRGSNDCVFYECDNEFFMNYIEKFGFVTNFGTFSDICEICPAWGVAGVNLSVGYYNEHSVSETLHIGQMFATIEKVKKMLKDISNAEYFKFIPTNYSSFYKYNYLEDDTWENFFNSAIKCANCGQPHREVDMTPVKISPGYTELFCPDCVGMNNIKICKKCGECFLIPDGDFKREYCQDCEKEVFNKC